MLTELLGLALLFLSGVTGGVGIVYSSADRHDVALTFLCVCVILLVFSGALLCP